ncbi:hypothetical protein HPB52_024289 [Rhipicephalus sanguineus]|uniref:ABC transporter domain-containing protein n=1 Tax=Rhipicephalus sanguineus TaxID=34632 RepID=A0A9D4SLW2_RHISA|nr:hypothetical protein HPB52_024289 [Rhipicephalus sanguineus]
MIKAPIYGVDKPSFTEFMAPGIIISITYIMAVGLTAISIVSEQKEGLLERSWVAGVRPFEVILSHVICQFLVMFVQVAGLLVFTFIVFEIPSRGPFVWVVLLTLLQGCGMIYGLVISSMCVEENSAIMLALGSFYPNLLLSGVVWRRRRCRIHALLSYGLPQTIRPSLFAASCLAAGASATQRSGSASSSRAPGAPSSSSSPRRRRQSCTRVAHVPSNQEERPAVRARRNRSRTPNHCLDLLAHLGAVLRSSHSLVMGDHLPTEHDTPTEGAASAAQAVSSVMQSEAHATSESHAAGEAPAAIVAVSNAAQTDTGSKRSGGKTPAVQIRGLELWYGGDTNRVDIFRGVDMTVQRGAIYALLGSSGCGKTTLLRCIMGRKRFQEGTIRVFGYKPGTEGSKIPGANVGYMPQEAALFDAFSIEETMHFFARIYDLPPEAAQQRAEFLRMSIIITTHYIDEARLASAVAFLRHGAVILAEDPPEVLMRRHNTDNLEEVFLILATSSETNNAAGGNAAGDALGANDGGSSTLSFMASVARVRSSFRAYDRKDLDRSLARIGAIFYKNVVKLRRSVALLLYSFLLPSIEVSIFCSIVGNTPFDLHIASTLLLTQKEHFDFMAASLGYNITNHTPPVTCVPDQQVFLTIDSYLRFSLEITLPDFLPNKFAAADVLVVSVHVTAYPHGMPGRHCFRVFCAAISEAVPPMCASARYAS